MSLLNYFYYLIFVFLIPKNIYLGEALDDTCGRSASKCIFNIKGMFEITFRKSKTDFELIECIFNEF